MARISSRQSNAAEIMTNAKAASRSSRAENLRTNSTEKNNDVPAAAAKTAASPTAAETSPTFASLLNNPFSGRYAEGEVPKIVLHTQDNVAGTTSTPSAVTLPAAALSSQGVPESVRLDAPDMNAAIYNSARSVTETNAKYNREALDAYNYQLQNWQANNSHRWLNGQWTKTEVPPPAPVLKETVFDKVLARIASGQVDTTPVPYYMGNAQAGQIYDYNAPLDYTGGVTTTYAVTATGERVGQAISTPQGGHSASKTS
jgi:hypothetical protein